MSTTEPRPHHALWRTHAAKSVERVNIDEAELLDKQLRELHIECKGTFRHYTVVCQRHSGQPPHPPEVCLDCGYTDSTVCADCDQKYPCSTILVLDARKAIRDSRKARGV